MNFLDKYQNKILIGIWSAIFLTCLFVIFSEPVKASSPSTELPLTIGIPDTLSDLGIDSNIVDSVVSQYINILTSQYSFNPSDNYTVFVSDVASDGNVYIVATYNLSISASYGEYDYILTYQNLSQHYVQFIYNSNNGSLSSGNFYGGWVNSWNVNSINLLTGKGWILDSVLEFPNYWVFPTDVPDSTGHATPPINDNGHYIPNVNPQHPNINPYQPSSPQFPTIDTSTLETLVESLIVVVEYGFNYVGGLISGSVNNLVSNIDNLLDYVIQSFSQGFNNVVGAIQDLATDFYNNMVSLFEPIYNFLSGVQSFFNHLIEIGTVNGSFALANIVTYLFIPDSATLYPIFVSHDEFNIIGIANHIFNEYRLFMSRVESINTLHYILIPSFTFHGQTVPQTRIDFEWFSDYKVYTDGIISAFLIVGYVYYLFTRISGWLRGNQGDVYVGDNSSNYHGTKIGF